MKVTSILSIVFSVVFIQIQAAPLGGGSDPLGGGSDLLGGGPDLLGEITKLAEVQGAASSLQKGGNPVNGLLSGQKTAPSPYSASGSDPLSGVTEGLPV
ncbi:unnamed protein product [Cunninghamella echinulata]